jgi:hypothetical protein
MRNDLDPGVARRSLSVSVVDMRGRALLPGAEVRVFTAGTHRLLGTRLVDTGSGYDAQSVMPQHFGIPASNTVDVEVTYPHAGRRQLTHVPGVEPRRLLTRQLVVKVPVN